jgi:hypothetical protein
MGHRLLSLNTAEGGALTAGVCRMAEDAGARTPQQDRPELIPGISLKIESNPKTRFPKGKQVLLAIACYLPIALRSLSKLAPASGKPVRLWPWSSQPHFTSLLVQVSLFFSRSPIFSWFGYFACSLSSPVENLSRKLSNDHATSTREAWM